MGTLKTVLIAVGLGGLVYSIYRIAVAKVTPVLMTISAIIFIIGMVMEK